MRFPSIDLLPVVAALMLLSVVTTDAAAQSMPAGQTSQRMANKSTQSDEATAAVLNQILNAPTKATPQGGVRDENLILDSTQRQSGLQGTSGSTSGDLCADFNGAAPKHSDQYFLEHSQGAARRAVWQKVTDMDAQNGAAYSATGLIAARCVAAKVADTLTLSEALQISKAAQSKVDTEFSAASTNDIHLATQAIVDAVRKQRCGFNTEAPTAIQGTGGDSADGATPTTGTDGASTAQGQPASTSDTTEAAGSSAKNKAKSKTSSAASSSTLQYEYKLWFPLLGPSCTDDAILKFFSVSSATTAANNAQYLYNAQQSASQISAQLLTSTFSPGLQVVLSGTTTAGSGQTSTSTSSGSTASVFRQDSGTTDTATTTADSVATAVAKIEGGGDFNVKFPWPVFLHQGSHGSTTGFFSPNIGFNINGIAGQSTITEATEYSANFPLEFYAQSESIGTETDGIAPATLFVDVKPSVELISSALAKAIQLTGSRGFFLGQASVGVEFSNSIRLAFQYIYGPSQIYQTATSTGTSPSGTSPTSTSRIGGFHLAVSFSPQKSKSPSQ